MPCYVASQTISYCQLVHKRHLAGHAGLDIINTFAQPLRLPAALLHSRLHLPNVSTIPAYMCATR